MATRSGGGSGAVLALVAFVFLFVMSSAMAVYFYTQMSSVQTELESEELTRSDFVNNAERASDDYSGLDSRRNEARRTVYGQLKFEYDELMALAAGDPSVSLEQIRSEAGDLGMVQGESLLGRVRSTTGELEMLRQSNAALQTTTAEAQAELNRLKAEYAALGASTEETIASLEGRLSTQKEDYDSHLAAGATERSDFADQHERVKSDLREQVRTLESQLQGLRSEIAQRDGRIRELESKLPKIGSPDITLEHDGKVLRVAPADNLLVIDIGRDDKLILGQMFEVFDEQLGVRVDEDLQGNVISRGKATIEVVRFSEDGQTATCRVVRKGQGETIVSGDLVSNLVYDKTRVFRFFVAGEFDLNGDGRATAVERRKIETLIEQWGAEVIDTETMPVDTDFLVLGREPEAPRRPGLDATENEWRLYNLQQQRVLEYARLRGQALQLNLPILSQNRFLSLVGFVK